MRLKTHLMSGAVVAAGLATMFAATIPAARADVGGASIQSAASGVTLAVGRGTLVRLSKPISDVFVADPAIADVQVRSPTMLYVFGKGGGETSVYATDRAGNVVYSANVRVGNNFDQVRSMLRTAMPDAKIDVTPMNGMVLLSGTVAAPDDVEEANRLVQAIVGKETLTVNRLKTATPMQVTLQVKIAEVSRNLLKEIGVNLLTRDTTGGFQFGISRGRNFGSIGPADLSALPKLDASSIFGLPAGSISLPFDVTTGQFVTGGTAFDFTNFANGKTALNFAGKLFGLDVASALDLLETSGSVTMLAEPSLTALSGETASFLAGGEVPIPVSQDLGTVTIEYKPYGVGLAFTPTVLNDGRISLRVRPEVSELDVAGSIQLNGFRVPGLLTRRVETTVELGSGQSFMIGGLLKNNTGNTTDKAPWLGDLPILGALFRSNSFRRNETELVIVVTPYLVKPVSADQIRLPTDGYRAPTDFQRVFGGQDFDGKSGAKPPAAKVAPSPSGAASPAPSSSSATPGFSLN